MKASYYMKFKTEGLTEAVAIEYVRSMFNSDYFGEFYFQPGQRTTLSSNMGTCNFTFSEGKIIHSFRIKDFKNIADAFLRQVKDHPKSIFYGACFDLWVPEEELKIHGLEECLSNPSGNFNNSTQSFGISIGPTADPEKPELTYLTFKHYKLEITAFNQHTDKDKLVRLNEKIKTKVMETMPGLPEPEIKII